MKIAIDVGHARGTGARGNGYEEHAVVSDIAEALADKLAALGHECHVVDFPEKDNRADLVATVKAVNALKPDISVSLHADCAETPYSRGGHVCYFPGSQKGIQLARRIAWHLVALLPGRAESTVARRDLYVLKNTCCPAVLVECGFITHPGDCKMMTEEPGAIADAIAKGITDYIK